MANTTPNPSSATAPSSFDLSAVLTSQVGRLSEAQLRLCSEAVDFFKKKMGSSETIEDEFQILEEQVNRKKTLKMKNKFSVSLNSVNEVKNRYPDVLPFDSNRIILKEEKDYNPFSPTGYINASPVATSDGVSRFIAAQGPLPETSEDFWEMIIQNKCPAIVMLTDLNDDEDNVKCGDYFKTKDGPREFGNITIVTKWMHTTESSLILRCIEVKNKKLEEPPYLVLHIQYPSWPDHGVLEDTAAVVREIFETASSSVPHDLGPIMVHCSAGIGRTGTYCGLHNTVQRILIGDETAFDLLDTVTKFRNQRVGMVQAKVQYEFCYKAIIDELENLIKIFYFTSRTKCSAQLVKRLSSCH